MPLGIALLQDPKAACVLDFEQPLYWGTSLTRKRTTLGPYRRPMPWVLGGSWGDGRCFMGEVPLDTCAHAWRRVLIYTQRCSTQTDWFSRFRLNHGLCTGVLR